MQRLDLSLTVPAEQLAADEVLLDAADQGLCGETLIFWEPAQTFVVVGYGNKVQTEVNVPACEARRVPIFRRCSGGGTVAQLPGGLNYSLILQIVDDGPTRNISSANRYIMERHRDAIQTLFPQGKISIEGHTDLALAQASGTGRIWRKFSGNSQRRRKNFLLFHGTLLLNCDLAAISELLQKPSCEPDYRQGRSHGDFVTNLGLSPDAVKTALAAEWDASELSFNPPLPAIRQLAREKYLSPEWNYKF